MNGPEQKLTRRNVLSAIFIGAFLAAGPFLFWRIFLQQLPISGNSTATIADRFQEPADTKGETDEVEHARLRELLSNPANSLSIDRTSGALRMYEDGTGRAFEVDPNTLRVITLSDVRLDGFSHTIWSPNGTEVITLFRGENGSEYRYYDYVSSRVAVLDPGIRTVSFSRNGDRIITTRDTQSGTQLWISAPDGTDAWLFMATRMDIIDVRWPNDIGVVAHVRRTGGTEDLVLFDMDTRLTLLLEDKMDMEVRWNTFGNQALVSYTDNEDGLVLSLLDAQSGTLRTLPITARASKCAWHSNAARITCGVPSQTTSASRDTITSLDLRTGELTVRYTPPQDIWVSMQNPVMLLRGNGIAFINAFDKRPYLVTW